MQRDEIGDLFALSQNKIRALTEMEDREKVYNGLRLQEFLDGEKFKFGDKLGLSSVQLEE